MVVVTENITVKVTVVTEVSVITVVSVVTVISVVTEVTMVNVVNVVTMFTIITVVSVITIITEVNLLKVIIIVIMMVLVWHERLQIVLNMLTNQVEISSHGSLRLRCLKQHILFLLYIQLMKVFIVTMDIRVAFEASFLCM